MCSFSSHPGSENRTDDSFMSACYSGIKLAGRIFDHFSATSFSSFDFFSFHKVTIVVFLQNAKDVLGHFW